MNENGDISDLPTAVSSEVHVYAHPNESSQRKDASKPDKNVSAPTVLTSVTREDAYQVRSL